MTKHRTEKKLEQAQYEYATYHFLDGQQVAFGAALEAMKHMNPTRLQEYLTRRRHEIQRDLKRFDA